MKAADYRRLQGLPPPGADRLPQHRYRTEAEFQAAVVRWWDALQFVDPAPFLFHVPNGGKRDYLTAAILQGMGVRRGVADLGLLLPGGRTAWLELKHGDGTPSDAQKVFRRRCAELGHQHAYASSFDQVLEALRLFGVGFAEPLEACRIRCT